VFSVEAVLFVAAAGLVLTRVREGSVQGFDALRRGGEAMAVGD